MEFHQSTEQDFKSPWLLCCFFVGLSPIDDDMTCHHLVFFATLPESPNWPSIAGNVLESWWNSCNLSFMNWYRYILEIPQHQKPTLEPSHVFSSFFLPMVFSGSSAIFLATAVGEWCKLRERLYCSAWHVFLKSTGGRSCRVRKLMTWGGGRWTL